jgi:hypothetical protein
MVGGGTVAIRRVMPTDARKTDKAYHRSISHPPSFRASVADAMAVQPPTNCDRYASISRRITGSMSFNVSISAGDMNSSRSGISIPATMSLWIVMPVRPRSRKRFVRLTLRISSATDRD